MAENPDRVLPAEVPVRLKCYLVGAGVRGQVSNIAEIALVVGRKGSSPFESPEQGWEEADRQAAALARLLDVAGPTCEVPERILSGSPAPEPPDNRIIKLLEAVRNRDREGVKQYTTQLDAWYELMSEEAVDPNASAKTA
jgi:hypothetical protein